VSDTVNVATVGDLRRAIDGLPDDRPILCQVIATNNDAWNMFCEFTALPESLKWASVLQLKHRELKRLPDPHG
jgi:hypothetical protein